MKYWLECISEAFDECGIIATDEQKEFVASSAEGAHENYGMANGHDVIHRSAECVKERRIKELEQLLRDEEKKTVCRDCNGNGYTVSYGGTLRAEHKCYSCDGKGKK